MKKARPYKFVLQVVSLVSSDDFETIEGEIVSDPIPLYGIEGAKDFMDSVGEIGDKDIPD